MDKQDQNTKIGRHTVQPKQQAKRIYEVLQYWEELQLWVCSFKLTLSYTAQAYLFKNTMHKQYEHTECHQRL